MATQRDCGKQSFCATQITLAVRTHRRPVDQMMRRNISAFCVAKIYTPSMFLRDLRQTSVALDRDRPVPAATRVGKTCAL
jgi:hypothetical protein